VLNPSIPDPTFSDATEFIHVRQDFSNNRGPEMSD
jgi:hypothetical protein